MQTCRPATSENLQCVKLLEADMTNGCVADPGQSKLEKGNGILTVRERRYVPLDGLIDSMANRQI